MNKFLLIALFLMGTLSSRVEAQNCEGFKASITRMHEIDYKIYNMVKYSLHNLMEHRHRKGNVVLHPTKTNPSNILITNADGSKGHQYTDAYIKKWETKFKAFNELRKEYKTLAKKLKKQSRKYYLTEDIHSYKTEEDKKRKFKNRAGYLIRNEKNRFHYQFSGYNADLLSLYSMVKLSLKPENGHYYTLDEIKKDFYETSDKILFSPGLAFYKDHVFCEVK